LNSPDSVALEEPVDDGTAAGSTASDQPTVTLGVQINKVVGEEETTESFQTFPDPDERLVEQQVRAIDWTNAQLRPSVTLGRVVDGGVRNIRIKGTLGAPNMDGELRSYWLGVLGDDAVLRRSPPLDVDAAIELLALFLHDDPGLQALAVDWEDGGQKDHARTP
jgi:hypothetical protein